MSDPLRAWVALRLPLLLALVLVAPTLAGDAGAALLMALPYPHGVTKIVLEAWQAVLYRQHEVPGLLAGAAGLALLLPTFGGRVWLATAAFATAAALFAVPWTSLPVALAGQALVLLAAAPRGLGAGRRGVRLLAWLPGTELVLPAVVSSETGLFRRPWLHRLLVAPAAMALALGWMMADNLVAYETHRAAMEVWPDRLVDPRVKVLDRVPAGIRAEWHGVDVVGDHAIVVAEETMRVIAYPLDGGRPIPHKLGPRWPPLRAATLDSETDPATGTTWLLDGPRRVRELRWTGAGWLNVGEGRLPAQLNYAYNRWDAEGGRLFLVTVQGEDTGPRDVAVFDVPGLERPRMNPLRQADGRPAPMPREVEWVPSLGRLVLAPDFGDRLWLADPETGLCEPWLEVPTLDGKLRWEPALERLVLAIPNRPELWLIDPVSEDVRRVPTQLGVRTAAVDAGRRLLLTASVLTGRLQVQDLDSGEVLERFGTLMPMARELELHAGRGVAVLSTWSVLYEVPYAEAVGR